MNLRSRPSSRASALFARAFLWSALLLLQACADSAKLSPLPADATVLAFGDSLTRGVGAPANSSYPSVLAQLTGLRVVNAGVSGETTTGGLPRLQKLLPELEPDLLLLLEGGNDILRSHSAASTRDNLAAMVELAREQGVQVVLIGVPNRLLFSSSADFYSDIAAQYDLAFDGNTLASLLRDSNSKSDAIHLNARGYRELAEALHGLLQDHGAL